MLYLYQGGNIRLVYLVIAFIIIMVAGGGYYYYYIQGLSSLNYSPSHTSSSPPNQAADESCAEFSSRFGTSSEELMQFINNEPDSAKVLTGYRYLFGEVIALTPGKNLPLFITLDEKGKITAFDCVRARVTTDPAKDIGFSIPETDFAQIVRYRESLEPSQAQVYLRNVTTNPSSAKQVILERIQMLEQ